MNSPASSRPVFERKLFSAPCPFISASEQEHRIFFCKIWKLFVILFDYSVQRLVDNPLKGSAVLLFKFVIITRITEHFNPVLFSLFWSEILCTEQNGASKLCRQLESMQRQLDIIPRLEKKLEEQQSLLEKANEKFILLSRAIRNVGETYQSSQVSILQWWLSPKYYNSTLAKLLIKAMAEKQSGPSLVQVEIDERRKSLIEGGKRWPLSLPAGLLKKNGELWLNLAKNSALHLLRFCALQTGLSLSLRSRFLFLTYFFASDCFSVENLEKIGLFMTYTSHKDSSALAKAEH